MTAPSDDVDRIMKVMSAAFDPAYGEAWTRRQVEDALLIGNCHSLLIDSKGATVDGTEAVGFSLSRTGFEEEELLLFAVAPPHRGRGLGRMMLDAVIAQARNRGASRMLLEMRRGNSADALYRAVGFKPIGERAKYYRMSHGEHIDAITFACDLPRMESE